MANSGFNGSKKAFQHFAYDSAAQNVSKTRQIVMLYDGVIKIVQQVKEAIQENRVMDRYNLLERACQVVIGLQSALDFEKGGDVAKLLYDYYSSIDMRLLSIHQNNRTDVCDQVVKELKMMRTAWDKVDEEHSSGGKDAGKKESSAQAASAANLSKKSQDADSSSFSVSI